MKHKIRMGVIGLGGIANAVHIPGILASDDAELSAICDIEEEKLNTAAEKYGLDCARCFASYERMMDSGLVDAVSICTPNNVHMPVALAAIERRLPFACEKPIGAEVEEAETLLRAIRTQPIPAMTCFSYRFKAAARYARQLVQSGALGKIRHVYAQYFQAWGESAPLIWRFVKSVTGSGALGDLGCHAIDLVRFITGLEVERVTAQNGTFIRNRRLPDNSGEGVSDVDDYSNSLVELTGGVPATFQITRFAYGRGNYQRIEIYGEKGAVVYRLEDEDQLEVCNPAEPKREDMFQSAAIPGDCRSDQMQSFFDLINGRADGLAATIEDGVVASRIMQAMLDSAEEGRRIDLHP